MIYFTAVYYKVIMTKHIRENKLKAGKEGILIAAQAVIARNGIDGCTMRSIAKEAGVTTGAIYHHFSSREEVMYSVMEKSLQEASRLATEVHEEHPPKDKIIDEVHEGIDRRFKKQYENLIQFVLMSESSSQHSDQSKLFQKKYTKWSDEITELMGYLYDCEDDKITRALGNFMLGSIDGLAMRLLVEEKPEASKEILAVYKYMLTEGLPAALKALNK